MDRVYTQPEMERAYAEFVSRNYYGSDSEPITEEFFRELWEEMTIKQKNDLVNPSR